MLGVALLWPQAKQVLNKPATLEVCAEGILGDKDENCVIMWLTIVPYAMMAGLHRLEFSHLIKLY